MNGREFLACAASLAANARPADLRSAVSRGYYAAFHVVQQYFNKCGIYFERSSPEAHRKMPMTMQNCNVPVVTVLASKLSSLRDDRNDADYDMDDTRFENSQTVQLKLAIANEIVRSIDQWAAEPNIPRLLKPAAKKMGLRVL